MSPSSVLQVNLDERGVGTLTLNRPHVRNALDELLISSLQTQLNIWQQNDKCRVLVIQGAGKSFCAGADLHWMQKMIHFTYEENLQEAKTLARLLETLAAFPIPTVAVVHGHVYGGALGLVAATDIAIAAPDTKFCFSEVKLGLIPAVISPYVLEAMGRRLAMPLMLTAAPFSVEQAMSWGLVHKIGSPGVLLEETLQHLLQASPSAQRALKNLVSGMPANRADQMAYTGEQLAKIRISADAQQRMKAFFKTS